MPACMGSVLLFWPARCQECGVLQQPLQTDYTTEGASRCKQGGLSTVTEEARTDKRTLPALREREREEAGKEKKTVKMKAKYFSPTISGWLVHERLVCCLILRTSEIISCSAIQHMGAKEKEDSKCRKKTTKIRLFENYVPRAVWPYRQGQGG